MKACALNPHSYYLKCYNFLVMGMTHVKNGVYFSGQSVHALIFLGLKDNKNGLLSSDGIDLYIVGNFGVGCHDVPQV